MNPETINPLALPSVALKERSHFPATPCIYFAISAVNKVLYIGRANNLVQRWKAHHRYDLLESIGGVRVAWVQVAEPDLLPEIEAALIAYFKPPFNGARLGNQQVGGLKELREKVGLRMMDVAADIRRSHSTLSNWESGKTLPMLNPLEFEQICLLYKCTYEEFVDAVKATQARQRKDVA